MRSLNATGQFTRGAALDRETTRWDPLSRKAGFYVGRGVRQLLSRPNSVNK